MGAARQPAQHIFGADDRERKALPVAVQGRDHHQPARLDHRRTARKERADIGDMLDHFHRQHDVEALAHVHRLDGRAAVVDRQVPLVGMQLGGRRYWSRTGSIPITCAPSRVSGSHSSPAPQPISRMRRPARQLRLLGFAIELAAAGVADVAEPQRIDLVQRGHLAPGSHHSSDSLENFATSAGSTVRGAENARDLLHGHDCAPPYRAVMELRNASGEAMVVMVFCPSPTPRS
jgi:hypothetical protein